MWWRALPRRPACGMLRPQDFLAQQASLQPPGSVNAATAHGLQLRGEGGAGVVATVVARGGLKRWQVTSRKHSPQSAAHCGHVGCVDNSSGLL